jgi:hypothetical protein
MMSLLVVTIAILITVALIHHLPLRSPMSEVTWQTDLEFIGANHAEHAMVGDYELLCSICRLIAPPPRSWLGIVRSASPSGIDRTRRCADIRRREGRSRARLRQALGLVLPPGRRARDYSPRS